MHDKSVQGRHWYLHSLGVGSQHYRSCAKEALLRVVCAAADRDNTSCFTIMPRGDEVVYDSQAVSGAVRDVVGQR